MIFKLLHEEANMYCERWNILISLLIVQHATTNCEIECQLMIMVMGRRFQMLNVNDRERQKSGHLISPRHRVVSLTVNRLDEDDVEESIGQEKNARIIRVSDILHRYHYHYHSKIFFPLSRYPSHPSLLSTVAHKPYFQINQVNQQLVISRLSLVSLFLNCAAYNSIHIEQSRITNSKHYFALND